MSGPERIQLSRRKGYRMPAGVVVVSRPTMWGNPYVVKPQNVDHGLGGNGGNRSGYVARAQHAVDLFRKGLETGANLEFRRMRRELYKLRGKTLACWCRTGEPCHGDVLLELANTVLE